MSIAEIEQGEAIVQAKRAPVAYELGRLYPGYAGNEARRDELGALFEAHGFTNAAEIVRGVDEAGALALACARIGHSRRDGLFVEELEATEDHTRAWAVCIRTRRTGERASVRHYGARVVASPAGIFVAPPVDEQEIPECIGLAHELKHRAQHLVDQADTVAVGHALDAVCDQAGAYPFISRGIRVVRQNAPLAEQLVRCFREIRARFYDEGRREGIRTSVIGVAAEDTQALSDAVLDDFERRICDLVDKLRAEAGNGKTRASTLERRRQEAASLLSDLRPVRELVGSFAERFEVMISAIKRAYDNAQDALSLEVPEGLEPAGAQFEAEPASEQNAEQEPAPEPPAPLPAPEPALQPVRVAHAPPPAATGTSAFDL